MFGRKKPEVQIEIPAITPEELDALVKKYDDEVALSDRFAMVATAVCAAAVATNSPFIAFGSGMIAYGFHGCANTERTQATAARSALLVHRLNKKTLG